MGKEVKSTAVEMQQEEIESFCSMEQFFKNSAVCRVVSAGHYRYSPVIWVMRRSWWSF